MDCELCLGPYNILTMSTIDDVYHMFLKLLQTAFNIKIEFPIVATNLLPFTKDILHIIMDYAKSVIICESYITCSTFGIEYGLMINFNKKYKDHVQMMLRCNICVNGDVKHNNNIYQITIDEKKTHNFYVASNNEISHKVEKCAICKLYSTDYKYFYTCDHCYCERKPGKYPFGQELGIIDFGDMNYDNIIDESYVGSKIKCCRCNLDVTLKLYPKMMHVAICSCCSDNKHDNYQS